MNDDITSREVELIEAVFAAMRENEEIFIIRAANSDVDQRLSDYQEGFSAGYQDALSVLFEVLQERGFDVKLIEEKVGADYDPD